ncbi:MAG: alpha/beta hydrolase, partial [Candidatus Magasanikbacteria bacterium]
LAFVMHGLGGFKEQSHIQVITDALLESHYMVVRFDTTNTLGESDGDYADATVTNYYADLEDVIGWAKQQSWYIEPFVLVGHSLGGICVALYAENYPEKIKALAPIATVVSGALSMEKEAEGELEEWKQTGWRIQPSNSKPGLIKRLKWSHMEDRLKYDLLPKANKLTMPTILIVGELDESTLPKHQQILFTHLPSKKEIHIIKGAPHTYKESGHLEELKEILKKWITNI